MREFDLKYARPAAKVLTSRGASKAELAAAKGKGLNLGGMTTPRDGSIDLGLLPLPTPLGLLDPLPTCVDQAIPPPFPITATEGGGGPWLDSVEVVDGRRMHVEVHGNFAGWPHVEAKLGTEFDVRTDDIDVTVTAVPKIADYRVMVLASRCFARPPTSRWSVLAPHSRACAWFSTQSRSGRA